MADDDVFAQFMSEVAEAEAEVNTADPPPHAPPPTAPPPASIPKEVQRAQATVLSAAPQKPTKREEGPPEHPPVLPPPPTTLLGKFYKHQVNSGALDLPPPPTMPPPPGAGGGGWAGGPPPPGGMMGGGAAGGAWVPPGAPPPFQPPGYSLADSKLTEDQIQKVKEALQQGQSRIGAPVPQVSLVKQLESVSGKGVPRQAAGQKWVDDTLAEWPENDYRIFVGDLGNDTNDDQLATAFKKYPSFNKAKVVRDRKTNKSRGYGFVSLQSGEDFAKAMREMQGKYVGNRPVKLRKSNWDDRTDNDPRRKKDLKRKQQGAPKPAYKKKHVLHI